MSKIISFLLVVLFGAFLISWMSDYPGFVLLNWGNYEITVSLLILFLGLFAFAIFIILAWVSINWIFNIPRCIKNYYSKKNYKKGEDALSRGMISVAAGNFIDTDEQIKKVDKYIKDKENPFVLILKAQNATLKEDRISLKNIFENMTEYEDTKILGMRGLFSLLKNEEDIQKTRDLLTSAIEYKKDEPWVLEAILDFDILDRNWGAAQKTIEMQLKNKIINKKIANRKKAVLMTAEAQTLEENDVEASLKIAIEANKLEPDLIISSSIAARIYSDKGQYSKADRIIERSWKIHPHPDLSIIYSYIIPGISPKERLSRIENLIKKSPKGNIESAISLANAAIQSLDIEKARKALIPYIDNDIEKRVCVLMSEIEAIDSGDQGKIREWLVRGLNAMSDPVWYANNYISPMWLPASPVTGELDVFRWGNIKEPIRIAYKNKAALSNNMTEINKTKKTKDFSEQTDTDHKKSNLNSNSKERLIGLEEDYKENSTLLDKESLNQDFIHSPDDPGVEHPNDKVD
ncbi:MAG: heme biosynthesis HemY N-terminal domain-containing protein [Alphaproteobacteria bacterium]|jgi:HemY protein|tara:strand:- start:76974 stop:78530 length:1557 start_codon:yes stop_codon:yes gene_type:complete